MLSGAPMSDYLDLADWRRRVAALYESLRSDARPEPEPLLAFRAARDRIFIEHPSSPVPTAERKGFAGVPYWPHDAALRFRSRLDRRLHDRYHAPVAWDPAPADAERAG